MNQFSKLRTHITSNRKTIVNHLFSLVGFFACTPVITLFHTSVFKILLIIALCYIIINNETILEFSWIQIFAASAIVTCLISLVWMPSSSHIANITGMLSIVFIALLSPYVSSHYEDADNIVRGVVVGAKVNVIWVIVQTITASLFSIDINDIIFTKMLNMVEVASQYKANGLVATGLCWNAGGIAAAFYILLIVDKRPQWIILTIISSLLTQSSTTIIGVMMCVVIILLNSTNKSFFINKSTVITSIISVGVIISTLLIIYYSSAAIQKSIAIYLDTTHYRINSAIGVVPYDSSAQAHLNYYGDLFRILSNEKPIQLLFGYGINCSGYPYSELTGQYINLTSWAVESDFINTLVGAGLIGAIALYGMLLNYAKSLWNKDKTYSALIIILVICGLLYNLQSVNSYWLILVETALVEVVVGKEDVVQD